MKILKKVMQSTTAMALTTSCIATLAVGALTQSAQAEDVIQEVSSEITGSVDKAKLVIPVLRYSSRLDKAGKLEVTLEEGAIAENSKTRDVMTVFAPNVRKTEVMLHSQDWYLTVDASGTMRGIYTVPRNNVLPSSVLRSLGEGFGILKVNPANSFFKVFPSAYELGSQLNTFTNAAQSAVCGNSNKPETLSASVDVKPGWSGAGRIKFDATWKVSELCRVNKPLVAKKAAKKTKDG